VSKVNFHYYPLKSVKLFAVQEGNQQQQKRHHQRNYEGEKQIGMKFQKFLLADGFFPG
jgi:hypothetical protein